MLKFESEFKINNKWEIGELVNIDINNHKYYIKVQKNQDETKIIEYDNKVLTCLNQNAPISQEEEMFNLGEEVEFYNGECWMKGTIKAKKGKMYVVSFVTSSNCTNSKIMYISCIRKITPSSMTTTLNLDNCTVVSIEKFQKLSYPNKLIKKFLSKLKKIFTTNEIEFIFYSNFNLYLFGSSIEKELIEKMINISYEHFTSIENQHQTDSGSSSSSNNDKNKKNVYKYKEDIVIEKLIYDMQKPKIKSTSAKVEAKTTKNINEISLTIKAKDESSLLEVIDILNMVQIYFTVSVSEKDNFFNESSKEKNINYYAKLYDIVSCNHYKYDDNSTTIRVVGKKDNVDYFKQTVELYFSSQELKKKKLNEVIDIKNQILNLS